MYFSNGKKDSSKLLKIMENTFNNKHFNINYYIVFLLHIEMLRYFRLTYIIKAGFVFQINPFNSLYRPIVLHIIPSVNGKANKNIIDTLYKIRKILFNYRIEILSLHLMEIMLLMV